MEQHPVPQDITGFKFKLVGDMTLKQFGELAFGAIMAYLFYASNFHPFVKWPLVGFFALFGVALAFLPIEERPFDLWLINFIKAIYRPTIFVWKKDSSTLSYSQTSPIQTPTPIPAIQPWPSPNPSINPVPPLTPPPTPTPPTPPPLSINELENLRRQKLSELQEAKTQLQDATREAKTKSFEQTVQAKAITIDELAQMRQNRIIENHQTANQKITAQEGKLNNLISQNKDLLTQIDQIKNKIYSQPQSPNNDLKTQLNTLSSQKDKLATEIASIRDQLNTFKVAPISTPLYQQHLRPIIAGPGVKVVEKPIDKNPTVSLTDRPNTINGMVIKENGTPLDGAIIIIKDKSGNSIRALKSNTIGQFIVSTPLENGTYYLDIERPGFTFDTLEVTLDGKIMEPMEIPARQLESSTQQLVTSN